MGVDAIIYFRIKAGKPLPNDFEQELGIGGEYSNLRPCNDRNEEDADYTPTHEVYTTHRYYGPGYERGPWPILCRVLMVLYACGVVDKVWYGGDSGDFPPECSIEKVLELSRHYMEVGHEPYRGARL